MKRKIIRRKKKLVPNSFDKAVFDVLHAIRNVSEKELAAKSGLHPHTIRRLRLGPKHGGTRKPQHMTYAVLLEVVNKEYVIRDRGSNE